MVLFSSNLLSVFESVHKLGDTTIHLLAAEARQAVCATFQIPDFLRLFVEG
jgi:hypothetical protein